MLFGLCTLGIAVGILLLPILWKMIKVVSVLQSLLEINQESIHKSIGTMPGLLKNAGQISSNIQDMTAKLKISVPVILDQAECVTKAAKGSLELTNIVLEDIGSGINETLAVCKKETSSFVNYFHTLEEVMKIICRIFSSGK
jgi:hypothetical protein